jgi:hypothetical protein
MAQVTTRFRLFVLMNASLLAGEAGRQAEKGHDLEKKRRRLPTCRAALITSPDSSSNGAKETNPRSTS